VVWICEIRSYSLCKDEKVLNKSKTCYLLCMRKMHVYHILCSRTFWNVPSLHISCYHYTIGWHQNKFVCFSQVSLVTHDKMTQLCLDCLMVKECIVGHEHFNYNSSACTQSHFVSSFCYSLYTQCL